MSNEQRYMAPRTGTQARIQALEQEREELERYVRRQKGKPWSSGAVNAQTRLEDIGHTIERLRSQAGKRGQATNADPRVVRVGGQEFLAPSGGTVAPATNADEGELWRSPVLNSEEVCGGRRETRFVEVPRSEQSAQARRELDALAYQRASNGGRGQAFMPIPTP